MPTEVWVNDNCAGLPPGTIVYGNGCSKTIGADAFSNIEDGMKALVPGGTLLYVRSAVLPGT